MSTQPILNIKLTGETDVTTLNQSISWIPVDKVEFSLTMINGNSPKIIDYSVVSKVRTMIFYGTGNYTVTITVGSEVISFESQDFFIFSPTTIFRNSITSISVSTTSTSEVEIQCRIYGAD